MDAVPRSDCCCGSTATPGRPPPATPGSTRCDTELVAFVDTDVDLDAGWLERLLGHFADPRVALVAPRVASGAAAPGAERQRWPTTSSGTRRSTSAARPGASPRARGSATSRRPRCSCASTATRRPIGGFDRGAALRRGRRRSCGGSSSRAGGALRAGGRRCTTRRGVVAGARRAARRLRRRRRRRWRGATAAPSPRCGSARGALGVWGLVAAGRPLAALGLAGGHRRRPGAQAARRAARRVAAPRRPRPPLRRPTLADAVRRGVVAAASSSAARRSRRARMVIARRRSSCRRCSTAGRRACSTTSPTAPACGRACSRRRSSAPLLPDLVSWPGRRPSRLIGGRRCGAVRRRVTLRLTRRHGAGGGPTSSDVAARLRPLVPSSRATATASAGRARRAAEALVRALHRVGDLPVLAVGTVHELADDRRRRRARRADAGRDRSAHAAGASRAAALDAGASVADPHRRRPPTTSTRSTAGAARCW